MASLPLPQSNYAQLESDIADSHHELNSDEEDLPPRPNSRLGFNSVPPEVVAPKVPPAPARSRKPSLKWTRSLFQKIGIPSLTSSSSSAADVDMDITTAPIISSSAEDDEDLDPMSLPILPSLSSAAASTSSLNLTDMDVDTGSSCDDEFDDSDSDGYSSGDSDIDLDSPTEYGHGGRDILLFPPAQTLPSFSPPAMPPSPSPAVPPAPTASLALPPAPRTPAPLPPFPRRATPASLPPLRTKYSCLPSPLSSAFDSHISYTNPLRHAYGHHGRSRHALLHLKYLWAIREDQWDAHIMRMRDAYAYEGVSPASLTLDAPPPPRHSSPSPSPPRAQSPDYSQSYVRLPPMTIHPRRGDLSALRDPYCAHIDRCFVGMPLWTMGKTLWMYDVHVLAGHRDRVRLGLVHPLEEKLIPDGTSEDEESGSEADNSMMASSMSTAGFSDDSDETLVESERSYSEDEGMDIMEDVDLSSDTEKVEPHLCSRPLDDYRNSKHRALMVCASAMTVSLPPPPRWETCWYKRYDILLELLRLDKERELAPQQQQSHLTRDSSNSGPPRSSLAVSVRPPHSRFFIGDEDGGDDWNGGDESWSEERWDEVLVMNRAATEDDNDDVVIVSNQVVVH